MRVSWFYRLGQLIYRLRVAVIVLWVIAILGCLPFLPHIVDPFKSTGFKASQSESALTDDYLDKRLGYNDNRFIIIYHSDKLLATDPHYLTKIQYSLKKLKYFPFKHEIFYPDSNKRQIAKDKHTAYVVILFKDNTPMSHEQLLELKSLIKKPKNMSMKLGGDAIFIESINQQTQEDLYKADAIAAPVSIIIMILVFGSIVAAIVPICLGGGCALIILISLYVLGHVFELSIFTLNIALLLGLCLSLDYALFIINRFRDELKANNSACDAIAVTMATAGKAVFFSGLAVFISLSALLLFPINILFSVGIGGMSAVFIAVAIATTLLPAVLAVLKKRINCLALFHPKNGNVNYVTWNFWHRLAVTVVARPVVFFIGTLLFLLMLGYPFLNVRFGLSDYNILPDKTDSRQFFNAYKDNFDENELTPILMVVKTQSGSILSKDNIAKLVQFTKKLKKIPEIKIVDSIVTTKPHLTKEQYQALYTSDAKEKNSAIRQLLETSTRKQFTVITLTTQHEPDSPKTLELIKQLRDLKSYSNWTVTLAGAPANNYDVFKAISNTFHFAVIWIIALTYIILLILLRSLFLPLKAILMNMLSLCVSYGILVFIFQQGHFHHLLNFSVQHMLDISMLIIIFCAIFGFSMDYEVFLLSRIVEAYRKTHDNEASIIYGIVKSSRIITSAAVIVIFICGSFMVADNLMVKQFGLGIAAAIFVDAFIIRTILVPATMVLVKDLNWYLPKWLNHCLPNGEAHNRVKKS